MNNRKIRFIGVLALMVALLVCGSAFAAPKIVEDDPASFLAPYGLDGIQRQTRYG